MSKVVLKKQQKEKALLNAAFDLFLKNGVHNTSISDITEKAGVAKGTFYLYFKDKFDIRDRLVADKSAAIFTKAYRAMLKSPVLHGSVEDKLVFLFEHSMDQLCSNKSLLCFVSRNLDWKVLKQSIVYKEDEEEKSVIDAYHKILSETKELYRRVEVMLFLVIELMVSTCCNVGLYASPAALDEFKPELFHAVRLIMRSYEIKNEQE